MIEDAVFVVVADLSPPQLIDSPDNLQYEEGTLVHLLEWSFTDVNPDSWVLYINGSIEDNDSWNGSLISVDLGGLSVGLYNATIVVNDTLGHVATSTVYLTVIEPTTTITTTSTSSTTTSTSSTTATPSTPTNASSTSTTTQTSTDTSTTPPLTDGGDTTILIVFAVVGAVVVIIIIIIVMKKKS